MSDHTGRHAPFGWLRIAAPLKDAMREFKAHGRSAFLSKHNLSRSPQWFIDDGEDYYDAQAIVTVAHRLLHPDGAPLWLSSQERAASALSTLLTRLGMKSLRIPIDS